MEGKEKRNKAKTTVKSWDKDIAYPTVKSSPSIL